MPSDADRLWVCRTCGVETGRAARPPTRCAICDDERQYVPSTGQAWVALDDLDDGVRRLSVEPVEPGLWGLSVEPEVGIGQRALLVQTAGGNLLWDVPGFISSDAVAQVRELGGIAAIVASHPHMYGVQLEWSAAFDDAPVWVSRADAKWLARRGSSVRAWSTAFEVLPGVTVSQPGGHFAGSAVAHWSGTADGKGALLTGDTIAPCAAAGWVTFMRSYPNRIPLSAPVVRRIADAVHGYRFDRLYGNFAGTVTQDAAAVVQRSAQRYAAWASGANDHLT